MLFLDGCSSVYLFARLSPEDRGHHRRCELPWLKPRSSIRLIRAGCFQLRHDPDSLADARSVERYLRKTSAEGILLVPISNRHMDLVPMLERLARNLNLVAHRQNDFEITPEEKAQGKSSSRWVMLARTGKAAAPLLKIGAGNDWMEGWVESYGPMIFPIS